MSTQCHGEYLIWRAAEGLPYPKLGEVAEIMAGEYAEEIGEDEPECPPPANQPLKNQD